MGTSEYRNIAFTFVRSNGLRQILEAAKLKNLVRVEHFGVRFQMKLFADTSWDYGLGARSHDYVLGAENYFLLQFIAYCTRGIHANSLRDPIGVFFGCPWHLLYFHCLEATIKDFLLVTMPYVIEHGVASVRQEGSDQLQRCRLLTVLLHRENYLGACSKSGELWKIMAFCLLVFALMRCLLDQRRLDSKQLVGSLSQGRRYTVRTPTLCQRRSLHHVDCCGRLCSIQNVRSVLVEIVAGFEKLGFLTSY